jgi:hypothetical protein
MSKISTLNLHYFVQESNRIEGILRDPLPAEIAATEMVLHAQQLTLVLISQFVAECQAGALLRERYGMNVRVGQYYPPRGSPHIAENLVALLNDINERRIDPFTAHVRYELLHPYMDGNGRSGRVIWLWQMAHHHGYWAELGFLHMFYYQTLRGHQ